MRLADCVAAVESFGGWQGAIRFESALDLSHPQWVEGQASKIATANRCSIPTALMLACTSFGDYQILGANIYAGGYDAPILAWWASPAEQDQSFSRFIEPRGFSADEDVTAWDDARFLAFGAFYNGNAAAYSAAMKKAAADGN